jgi:hypothetical protein
MISLADVLGTAASLPTTTADAAASETPATAQAFCQRILQSREFRAYLLHGLAVGSLPAAVVCRIMDFGWGKPAACVEPAGNGGGPTQPITRVERLIIDHRRPPH